MGNPVYNKATDTWEYDTKEKEAEAKLAQTRSELRAMLSGNQPFYEDPRAARASPEHAAPYGKKDRVLNSLGSAMQTAYENIGGCSCHLGHAPCMSCTHDGHPISLEETSWAWEDNEGWTANTGEEPDFLWLPKNFTITVEFRNGQTETRVARNGFRWAPLKNSPGYDIIRWREA